MQESVALGIIKYIKDQTPEFKHVIESYFDVEQGFTESLQRRLAKVDYDIKETSWTATMWNLRKPEILSHRPKIFKVKDVQFVNNKGDLVDREKAVNETSGLVKPGFKAVSPDYRYTIVQSVLQLDFIFNSIKNASLFQELFTLRLYLSQSTYVNLPVLGPTCIYIDEIAMGDIDKFDRTAQGTLLSLPIDMVLTYPLIAPVLPKEELPCFTQERKPLINDIEFNQGVQSNLDSLE